MADLREAVYCTVSVDAALPVKSPLTTYTAPFERPLPSRLALLLMESCLRFPADVVLGAMVLAHSLRDHGAKAKIVVLVTLDSLQPSTVDELKVPIYSQQGNP